MKKITIELTEDLNVKGEGIETFLEAIGLLEMAKYLAVSEVINDENLGQGEITEQ